MAKSARKAALVAENKALKEEVKQLKAEIKALKKQMDIKDDRENPKPKKLEKRKIRSPAELAALRAIPQVPKKRGRKRKADLEAEAAAALTGTVTTSSSSTETGGNTDGEGAEGDDFGDVDESNKRVRVEVVGADSGGGVSEESQAEAEAEVYSVAGVTGAGMGMGSMTAQNAAAASAMPMVIDYGLNVNVNVNEQPQWNNYFYFKEHHDKRIFEAIEMYGKDWVKVAAYVGDGVTNRQVCLRWSVIDPKAVAVRQNWTWTPEKDLKLALAVGQLGRKWVKVAEFMGGGVTRDMCFDRWRRHVDPRVAAKKKPKGPWNPEKDDRLRTAVETFGRDWIRVSEYVGGGITANQCCMHWDNVVDPQVAALKPKFKGPWTPDEDKRLADLVEQYRNKGRRGGVDWLSIAQIIGRAGRDCCTRWYTLEARSMKLGPFSPEEDELILRMAEEYEGNKKGKWSMIAKALGRPRDSVGGRYRTIKDREERAALSMMYPMQQTVSMMGGTV